MSFMFGQCAGGRRSGPYATKPGPLLVSEQFIHGALDFYRVPTRYVRVQDGRLDLGVASSFWM